MIIYVAFAYNAHNMSEVLSYSTKKHLGNMILNILGLRNVIILCCLKMQLFFPMHNYCFLKYCACGKIKILGCQDG